MTTPSSIIGTDGESVATRYLLDNGYVIRERNARFGRHELDIVAFDPKEDVTVFAEVKSRAKSSEAYPVRTAVDKRKRGALRQAIHAWIIRHDHDGPCRLDIISVSNGKIEQHLMDVGSEMQ